MPRNTLNEHGEHNSAVRALFVLLLSAVGCFGQAFSFNDIPFIGQGETWTPSNRIADVTFWYRADSYTFSDLAGTTASTNGGIIRNWKSMNGNVNFSQLDSAGTHSPLLFTNVQNGRPGVFCNGAMWTRSASDISTPSLGTIYICAWSTNVAITSVIWSHADSADADSQHVYFPGGAGIFALCEIGSASGCPVVTTAMLSEATIGTAQHASASLRYVWKNGGSAGTNTTTVNFTGSFEGVYVGDLEGTSDPFLGFIFEIVMMSTVDTDAQRLQMHNYLDRIWAVPGYP